MGFGIAIEKLLVHSLILFFLFEKLTVKFNLCYTPSLPLLGVGPFTVEHGLPTRSHTLETDSLPKCHQLSINPHWGVMSLSPLHSSILTVLIMCRQPQVLRVYEESGPVIPRRLLFPSSPTFECHGLLSLFCTGC